LTGPGAVMRDPSSETRLEPLDGGQNVLIADAMALSCRRVAS